MSNPTPHIENAKVDGGDRANPVITDITKGGKENSRIWHTKENNQFFEYRQKNINKKSVHLNCIYFEKPGVKCPGKMIVKPNAPNLINSKKNKNEKKRFSLNYEAPLNIEDWSVVENSGTGEHTEYCCNQVARRDRVYDQNILHHGTPAEIRKEKAKYPRLGPFGGFNRGYRTTHTDLAKSSQRLETGTVEKQWSVDVNHGAQFLPMVVSMIAEKKSAYYHKMISKIEKIISDDPTDDQL